jgi:hypothetical protein
MARISNWIDENNRYGDMRFYSEMIEALSGLQDSVARKAAAELDAAISTSLEAEIAQWNQLFVPNAVRGVWESLTEPTYTVVSAENDSVIHHAKIM